jgi:hypothetical protein
MALAKEVGLLTRVDIGMFGYLANQTLNELHSDQNNREAAMNSDWRSSLRH